MGGREDVCLVSSFWERGMQDERLWGLAVPGRRYNDCLPWWAALAWPRRLGLR